MVEGCIESFLGDNILASPQIIGSKIPDNLKEELELPISIEELDTAAADGNNSAAGMDGFNNKFIKRFWAYLRTPLHRYAMACFRKKKLSANFDCACIRLIPKKGDVTLLKNWRPISLLPCLYKVLSRALNNKLKKAVDYCYSRGQKGFTSSRHIQEVLLNVLESINHCQQNEIPGAVLSIDQSKAFDSVSQPYMREVYKFFNFGENFINQIETLGNNRKACIILDDGSMSENFQLEVGRSQGNGPSPVEYNLAQQI
jgi:hypothetical protein